MFHANRPWMPGYGTLPPEQGTGLLPWEWAEAHLEASRDFWLATVRPDGRPHLMPVWAMWMDGALWFSCSNGSRKTLNLLDNPRCSLATEDPEHPVVVEGVAERVDDVGVLQRVIEAENAKYQTSYSFDVIDPSNNTCFKVTPTRVIGLDTADFTGSPTRWTRQG